MLNISAAVAHLPPPSTPPRPTERTDNTRTWSTGHVMFTWWNLIRCMHELDLSPGCSRAACWAENLQQSCSILHTSRSWHLHFSFKTITTTSTLMMSSLLGWTVFSVTAVLKSCFDSLLSLSSLGLSLVEADSHNRVLKTDTIFPARRRCFQNFNAECNQFYWILSAGSENAQAERWH